MNDDGLGNYTTTIDLSGINYFTFGQVTAVLSVDDLTENSISFYPNPADDFLTITTSQQGLKSISIFDLNGRLVKTINTNLSSHQNINVSDLQDGLYFITAQTANGSISEKFIVHRD